MVVPFHSSKTILVVSDSGIEKQERGNLLLFHND
jgi:hypothetical protein